MPITVAAFLSIRINPQNSQGKVALRNETLQEATGVKVKEESYSSL